MDGTTLQDVLELTEDDVAPLFPSQTPKVLELFSGTHSIGKVAHRLGYEVVSLDRDLGGECPFDTGYKSDTHIKADIMDWDYKSYEPGHFDVITASPVCLWWSHLRSSWLGRKCKKIHPTDVITKAHIQADIDRYGKPMVDKVFEIIDYFKPKHWWVENPATGRMKEYIDKPFYDVDYCKYSDWGYKKRTRFWTNIKGFEPKKCKMDCENVITIKTQKGDKWGGLPIKGKERTLHTGNIGNHKKINSIKSAIAKGEVIKQQHRNVLANGYEMIDGKKVLCNTKEKREKLRKLHRTNLGNNKQQQLIKKYTKDIQKIGGGGNRLERYRIPEKLIEELFLKVL